MFSMFVCVHLCLLHAIYIQMSANWCKYMLRCTSMLPPMSRVALNSVQQSYPRSLAQRLIRPRANGWINYLHGLGLLRIDIQC